MLRIKVLSATVALSLATLAVSTASYGTNLYVTAFNELLGINVREVFTSDDLVSCINRKPDNNTTKSVHD